MLTYHGTPETYHFANWVLYSGRFDPAKLVAEAESMSEEVIYIPPLAGCEEDARDERAEKLNSLYYVLESLIESLTSEYSGWHEFPGIAHFSQPDNYANNPLDALFYPLLNRAVDQIDFSTAAKIILQHVEAIEDAVFQAVVEKLEQQAAVSA